MNEHEHTLVISCPHCGHQSEITLMDIIDSKENEYEKQRLMSDNFFEYHCEKCDTHLDLCHEIVYRDADHNVLVYLVHDEFVEGFGTALRLNDELETKYNPEANRPRKRIVTCPHQLREKALIFDNELDDRIIELAKIFCAHGAMEAMHDFYSMGAVFNVKDGEFVIELIGEDERLTAKIPDGFYDHLMNEFAEVLENDNPYIVDEAWALDVLGIDPHDDIDCDGDCEHCANRCEDDFDDEDEECIACERDCNGCDCLRCEDDWDEDDEDGDDHLECDGNCAGCHGCDEDGDWQEDEREEWDDADIAEEDDKTEE